MQKRGELGVVGERGGIRGRVQQANGSRRSSGGGGGPLWGGAAA